MDGVQKQFLHILRAALNGDLIPASVHCEDWPRLFAIAHAHKVLPLVLEACCQIEEVTSDPSSPAFLRLHRRQVMTQEAKTAEFLQLYRTLVDSGLQPVVVKGIVCRSLYPQPDHRPSSDEDILIPSEQLPLCRQLLEQSGMHPRGESAGDEISYYKENSPLHIELHSYLFPPDNPAYGDLNRFFPDSIPEKIVIQDNVIYTLPPTDHLQYLIFHAFKHFLHSGFGIRQVCDIVLYANRYGNRIDWQRIVVNCKVARCHIFAAALFKIGQRHLGFDPKVSRYPDELSRLDVDESAMLEDLLDSGAYGTASIERVHSSSITLNATSRKRGNRQSNALLAALFPPVSQLQGQYSYLKNHPWLLPVAWCSRILKFKKGHSTAAQALQTGNHRVALLEQYGIIERT